MDTIILAAGRGSRLEGIAPPYFKPLLIVDGEPLIRAIARTAADVVGGRTVIVAAPENTLLLCQVLAGIPAEVVVQREPRGPGDALLTGLRLVTSPEVYVLLGDNVVSPLDAEKVAQATSPAVGVVPMPLAEVERFTYLTSENRWVEKVAHSEENADGHRPCWVGPLKLRTQTIRAALERWIRESRAKPSEQADQEVPIGPLLNQLGPATLVEVAAVDVGVPAAWTMTKPTAEG
ncbi:NTP transferase domain-containing protein [Amycolatopsis sp. NPDC049868]|uniref:NTP transferase domain-containing protein n=1 Tax=Amycolatopsis sp. NPDC049868 TaxID=3363934 RepID=UPI00379D4B26